MKYLYHYTNIEALASILENQTIRFTSLDKMDDLQEKESADLKKAGQFCYISSWTDQATESIPMWNMYASLDRGIRIRLCENPFKFYCTTQAELEKLSPNHLKILNGDKIYSIIPLVDMFRKGYCSPQAMARNILFQVEYTNDKNKLYPTLRSINGKNIFVDLGKLGKYKNCYWNFQSEWRYILNFYPLNFNQPVSKINDDINNIANNIFNDSAKQPFPYYDMVISDKAFSNMIITLSPKMSAGNRTIVQALQKAFNPNAHIEKSALTRLI